MKDVGANEGHCNRWVMWRWLLPFFVCLEEKEVMDVAKDKSR